MDWRPDGRLAVFISDLGTDGIKRRAPGHGPQEPDSPLGKSLTIDPATGAVAVTSLGHRNAGGIVAAPDGRIWLKLDTLDEVRILEPAVLELPPDMLAATDTLAVCSGCHQVVPGRSGHHGAPTLVGVLGRPIAAFDYAYSEALKSVQGRWDIERLTAFLANPQGWAPGTSMPAIDLARSERERVVEALATISSGLY